MSEHKFRAKIVKVLRDTEHYKLIVVGKNETEIVLTMPGHIQKDVGNFIYIKRTVNENNNLFNPYYEVIR